MENETQNSDPAQSGPKLPARSSKVIQPINDMSEYVNSPPVQPPSGSDPAKKPVNPASVYPTAVSQQAQPPAPALSADDAPKQTKDDSENERVASRIPILQVYAFVTIFYAIYTILPALSVFTSFMPFFGDAPRSAAPLLFFLVVGLAPIYLAVSIYLLIARNIKVVGALLMAMLIISGLSLLNTIVEVIRFSSLVGGVPTLRTIISLVVSTGLLIFLWHVRSEVELERAD